MLNRIYIIVGLMAIIVLVAAFTVPRFVQWSDYRERMETISSNVLGADVSILGDIEFSLLPAPRLSFSDVVVGDLEEPSVTVEFVDAEFSLIEFLRDHYNLTRFDLIRPVIDLTVDENGLLTTDFSFDDGEASNVVLESARIEDGSVRVTDRRSGENHVLSDVDGSLRLSGFSGPFQFQGRGTYNDAGYRLRLNTAAVDSSGQSRMSAFIESMDGRSTFALDGQFMPGPAPRFDGDLIYRHASAAAATAADISGDLVLQSAVEASTDRVVLSGFSLLPDENRPGTRLTGAASIQLGARHDFDAVISGGVFSLPPRDASEDPDTQPYELVRLLRELPPLPVPPIPGTVEVDLAEMGLRGFSLRNVRVEAATDGDTWQVDRFLAGLPGGTELVGQGTLTIADERPQFRGTIDIMVDRLDALVQIWRQPEESNPLFNVPARYSADIVLGAEALALSSGRFTFDGTMHSLDLRLGFRGEERLDVNGRFSELDAQASEGLLALLPRIGTSDSFALSFPEGSFSLRAETANVLDLDGRGLAAEGAWGKGRIVFDRLAAERLGGLHFDAELVAEGSIADPGLTGSGSFGIQSADATGLARIYETLDVPVSWQSSLARFMPFETTFDLEAADAGQSVLSLDGRAGNADLGMTATFQADPAFAFEGPLSVRGYLEAEQSTLLTRQFGLGSLQPFDPASEMLVAFNIAGEAPGGLTAQITASAARDSVSYRGDLAIGENPSGQGTLEVRLSDAGAWLEVLGARGAALPPLNGTASMRFEGLRNVAMNNIQGTASGAGFSGDLEFTRSASGSQVEGDIHVDHANAAGLARMLAGASGAAVLGSGPWPDGPFDIPPAQGVSRGAISVDIPELRVAGSPRLADTRFDLTWSDSTVRINSFTGALGGGQVRGSIALCCDSQLTERTLSGQAQIDSVALADVLPAVAESGMTGRLTAGLQFEGTGEDLREVMSRMAGEGNLSIEELTVAHFDPDVYRSIAQLDDILEMDAEALRAVIDTGLDRGRFVAGTAQGVISMAGGTARMSNLRISGDDAVLMGGLDLDLATLGLNGNFTMTPFGAVTEDDFVSEQTGRITAQVSGTLDAPVAEIGTDAMVAAIQVRANEIEVDRLEALRQEAEARQREAAEERNRLVEEQLRQMAEEEAAEEEPDEEDPNGQDADAPVNSPEIVQDEGNAPEGGPANSPIILQPGFQLDNSGGIRDSSPQDLIAPQRFPGAIFPIN